MRSLTCGLLNCLWRATTLEAAARRTPYLRTRRLSIALALIYGSLRGLLSSTCHAAVLMESPRWWVWALAGDSMIYDGFWGKESCRLAYPPPHVYDIAPHVASPRTASAELVNSSLKAHEDRPEMRISAALHKLSQITPLCNFRFLCRWAADLHLHTGTFPPPGRHSLARRPAPFCTFKHLRCRHQRASYEQKREARYSLLRLLAEFWRAD